jgi:hypothetical protein
MWCVAEKCAKTTTTIVKTTTTTTTTVKFPFSISTTTMTIPAATFCGTRTYARGQGDCDGLICRGGDCRYIADDGTSGGHCTCKYSRTTTTLED